jgi:hypothetical protein
MTRVGAQRHSKKNKMYYYKHTTYSMRLTASYIRMNGESKLKIVKGSVCGLIELRTKYLLAGKD